MKKVYNVESIPAVKSLSDYFGIQNKSLPPRIINDINNVLEGVERLDGEVKQKEQLLVQREKELERLKLITDNSSKVSRDVISESKANLDQAVSLHKSGQFSEALKYSDIALYNIGDINSFGIKTVEQANKLYVERLELYKESVAKRDYFYNQGVINGVNAFSWVKDNPTRDFYSFFRDTLKVSDKSPENVNLIQNRLYKNLPKYLEEAQRTNHFYNEYNKYHDVLLKLQQVINIFNIKAASSKGLKDYEDALKSCEIALEIDPTSATLVNLKNAVLKEKQVVEAKKIEEEKLLVSQTQEIEKLKELLAHKEVETKEQNKLWTQKGNELASTEKVLIDKHQKETEALKALLAQKELEHQELLARKDKEVKELEKVKNELLTKELLEILPQAYPVAKGSGYNKPFEEWDTSWWGRQVIDAGNFEEIKRYLPELREKAAKFKEENLEKRAKELENAKRLQEENIKKEQLLANKDKLLSDKEQRIEELKALIEQSKIEKEELLAKQELAVANKSHMKNQIIDGLKEEVNLKENDNFDLRLQNLEKELTTQEKEKLLAEQDIRLQNLLDLNAKLDAKMQYSAKEIKIREAEKEILSKIVNQKNDQLKYLLLEKENAVDNKSFEKNQVIKQLREEIIDLNKQLLEHDQHITHSVFLDEVGCQPGSSLFEKQLLESLNLSSINLSPINHGEQNQIVGNILGNFDIDNQHITHSVLISGEESFSIIKDDVSH